MVVLAVVEPRALPLLAVVLTVLFLTYRSYVGLARRYGQLGVLYRFVGSVGNSASRDAAVEGMLREARSLLCAERATLVVRSRAGSSARRTTVDSGGLRATVESPPGAVAKMWWAPALGGEPVLRRRVGARSDGLAVPLRTVSDEDAVLVVEDRAFEGETFTSEDLRLLEALAGHARVALDNGALVDRLRLLVAQREHEARHDALTGLPNRREFQERVAQALDDGLGGVVVLIDLDDFKDVNVTLGHSAGDALLCRVGARLEELLAPGADPAGGDALVARLGGDEFALLLRDTNRPDVAHQQVSAMLAALAEPLVVDEVNLLVTGSAGITVLGEHGDDAETLLAHADVALYAAKHAGGGVAIFAPDDDRERHRRLRLAADLAGALTVGALEVWYQPQADARTGAITGMEALLRWKHPVYGWVNPEEIVAVAERTGLMRAVTDQVLGMAVRERATWAAAGYDLAISVNVSTRDLHDAQLPDVVAALLRDTGTPAGRLTMEITEGGVMSDPVRCLAVLDRLAARGVQLSVDDFGTGYSSLAYLERLPVREVKIDRSFVQRLQQRPGDATVIRATVALAHDLHLTVVAEGVESLEVWSALTDLGVDVIQGYHLARPMPGADARSWLTAGRPVATAR